MEEGRYYIYEICSDGTVKKASLLDFRTKEEAEKSIISSTAAFLMHLDQGGVRSRLRQSKVYFRAQLFLCQTTRQTL